MAASAPVCNISPSEPITQPDVPNFPSIPVATDLPSSIIAINAMAQGYRVLTGQQGTQGNLGPAGPQGFTGPTGPMGPPGGS